MPSKVFGGKGRSSGEESGLFLYISHPRTIPQRKVLTLWLSSTKTSEIQLLKVVQGLLEA
jgi:hypothetical protein